MLAKANFARPLLAWSLEGAHSPSSAGSSQDLQLGIISRPTNRVLCHISPVLGFHLKVQQRASCLTGSGNLTFMTWWFAKFCSHQCCSTEALYAKIYCNVPNSPWSKYDKWVRIWTSAQKEHLLKRKYELRFFHLRFLLSFFMARPTSLCKEPSTTPAFTSLPVASLGSLPSWVCWGIYQLDSGHQGGPEMPKSWSGCKGNQGNPCLPLFRVPRFERKIEESAKTSFAVQNGERFPIPIFPTPIDRSPPVFLQQIFGNNLGCVRTSKRQWT